MRRTNIYLDESQIDRLTRLAAARGTSMAECVREAVEGYLVAKQVVAASPETWSRDLAALLDERQKIAEAAGWTQDEVDSDVLEAIREVRAAQRASGH